MRLHFTMRIDDGQEKMDDMETIRLQLRLSSLQRHKKTASEHHDSEDGGGAATNELSVADVSCVHF